jgi:hypothetical protein
LTRHGTRGKNAADFWFVRLKPIFGRRSGFRVRSKLGKLLLTGIGEGEGLRTVARRRGALIATPESDNEGESDDGRGREEQDRERCTLSYNLFLVFLSAFPGCLDPLLHTAFVSEGRVGDGSLGDKFGDEFPMTRQKCPIGILIGVLSSA